MDSPRPWNAQLREWQANVFSRYQRHEGADFLLVATPGSGKTQAALRIAHWLLESGQISRLVIVVPSSHLRRQWAEAAHAVSINLDPEWENRHGRETADFHGIAITYHAVSSEPLLHRKGCTDRPTLVILDEIHHAGQEQDWGEAIATAFSPAARRLALSGTPFRSDSNRIPFVRYEEQVSRSDASFSYNDALKEGVIRSVLFPHHEGEMEWLDNGEACTATFSDELNQAGMSKRLRTALLPSGQWLRDVITEANEKLLELRQGGHPSAGGLVLAMDQLHANRVADLLRSIADDPAVSPAARALLRDPMVATSDDPAASDKIASFRDDSRPWMVAVRMVSEGVDVPRLRVGVYASNVVTELFFRQVVGRFVRWLPGIREQTAYLYIPADERLVEFAREVQKERDHFIDDAAQEEGKESPPRPRPETTEPNLGMFMPVDASAAVSQGIIHEAGVLLPAEVGEARELLADVAALVPEHVLVSCLRRVKQRFSMAPPAPVQPPVHEQTIYRARDTARQVRNERSQKFAGFILKVVGSQTNPYSEIIQLVNRKLADHTGSYAADSTCAQLRQGNQLLVDWTRELGQAVNEKRAADWLRRWEESRP